MSMFGEFFRRVDGAIRLLSYGNQGQVQQRPQRSALRSLISMQTLRHKVASSLTPSRLHFARLLSNFLGSFMAYAFMAKATFRKDWSVSIPVLRLSRQPKAMTTSQFLGSSSRVAEILVAKIAPWQYNESVIAGGAFQFRLIESGWVLSVLNQNSRYLLRS